MIKKAFIFLIFLTGLFFFTKIPTLASEGLVALRSTAEEPARCYAASVKLQNQKYTILFSCRDIVYPGGETVLNYIVWANPLDGGDPIRLGEVGTGKAVYETKDAFSGLFVTTEEDSRAKSPSSNTVLRGTVEKITHLEGVTTPTPIPEGEPAAEEEMVEEESGGSRLSTALKRAGVVILLALAAAGGLIFVLTRPRS